MLSLPLSREKTKRKNSPHRIVNRTNHELVFKRFKSGKYVFERSLHNRPNQWQLIAHAQSVLLEMHRRKYITGYTDLLEEMEIGVGRKIREKPLGVWKSWDPTQSLLMIAPVFCQPPPLPIPSPPPIQQALNRINPLLRLRQKAGRKPQFKPQRATNTAKHELVLKRFKSKNIFHNGTLYNYKAQAKHFNDRLVREPAALALQQLQQQEPQENSSSSQGKKARPYTVLRRMFSGKLNGPDDILSESKMAFEKRQISKSQLVFFQRKWLAAWQQTFFNRFIK